MITWLKKLLARSEPMTGEILSTYTKDDARDAPPGHMPFPGTDIEVVAYREGDDLVVLVNKTVCVFRTRLIGAFRDDLDLMRCNVLMSDQRIVLGEVPQDREELIKKMMR